MYESEAARFDGIESVKNNAPEACINDQSHQGLDSDSNDEEKVTVLEGEKESSNEDERSINEESADRESEDESRKEE